jgi:PAS domain S-box-containing protein
VYQPIVESDGSVSGIFVQGSDITEQKRLAEERERLATIVEQSTDFIGVGDAEGNALWVNEAGRRLLGLESADEVRRQHLLDFFLAADRALVRDVIEPAMLASGQWTGDLRFRHFKTGETIDVHCNIFSLRDPATGEHVGVATVSRDMRAQRALEAERAALLGREKAARADAERANQLKDEFLATVSHELRTPLNAIQGWAQILRGGQLPESRRAHALETIERNARTQAQIIDDILDVSRIMSGKLLLDVEPIDLSAVVDSAMETLRPAAEAKGIVLEATRDPRARVMGDPVRLQQVVWNLLSNAVKFTAPGGRARVVVARTEQIVEVEVSDTGRGISAEFLPHVFERFRQAEGSMTRTEGGLGLGLSIVKQIVELHGGTVTAVSAGNGKGATFAIRLPVLPARARDEAPLAPAREVPSAHSSAFVRPPAIAGMRVLVVDDEEDTRELLTEILEQCGAHVATAASAAQALALIRSAPLDAVVSDVGMPGEDGYSLLRKVRLLTAAEGGRVPAIALTAFTRAEDRARAHDAGFDAHVSKPLDIRELLEALASVTSPAPGGESALGIAR